MGFWIWLVKNNVWDILICYFIAYVFFNLILGIFWNFWFLAIPFGTLGVFILLIVYIELIEPCIVVLYDGYKKKRKEYEKQKSKGDA